MESTNTFKMPPTDTFTVADEEHEVKRCESAVNDLVGPMVVGGTACADKFRWVGSLQAGVPSESMYSANGVNDNDADDKHLDLRPW